MTAPGPLLHEAVLGDAPWRSRRPAVVWPSGSLTHGELARSTRRIAARFRRLGIGPGQRVAVCLPKRVESVQVILGVLAAGATYVPVDATLPAARLRSVIAHAEPSATFLTDSIQARLEAEGATDGLGPITTVHDVGTGHGLDAWLGDAPDAVPPPIGSETTAAILYTSGSTGTPKGVMLSHANVSSFVGWAIDRFALGPGDRFASLAPFHFDLSTLDLFAPLVLGASVFLLDETVVRFPAAVAKTLERERVSVWYSVPTTLRLLTEHGGLDRRDLAALRLVLFAGEVFPVPALRRLMAAVPRPRYANLYGPTETNVCTYYVVPDPLPASLTALPVGVPCEHVQVTIADGAGQPVPPGEAGEICVEGRAVMQGYWREPEASRAARAGGREGSYRTGDFGAWQADGTIRFLGRRDHQVKIRGHRVDLLEIEHWLAVHFQVGQAAAVVIAPESLEARIVAFATPSGPDRPTAESLRQHCARGLPAPAVPSRVVVRETLPRTSTGKLDRRRLGEWAAEAVAGPLPAREARP